MPSSESGPERPVRVALVDDYEIVVRGLARMFDSYTDRIDLVELDAHVPISQPVDIALYDTFAQDQADRADFTELLSGGKAAKLVVYSWNVQPELLRAARDRGAAAYLSKGMPAALLVESLEQVHRGEPVTAAMAPGEPEVMAGDWPGRAEGLTPREAEVVALITQGLSNQQVADRAFLSINSVKSYIRSAYQKMGVTSRSQAVLWGVRHGLEPDVVRIVSPETR
ncbi:MAG: response regulator transcription factor [Terracoccus sp.]